MDLKKIIPIIGFIILIYILVNIDLNKILSDFSIINPIYLFLSIFSISPVILLLNFQWQIMLKKQKIKVSYLYSLKNIFIGYFYGFISPGGYGAYARIYYLKNESKTSLQKCFSNVILLNTIDYISLLILGIFGIIILLNRSPGLLNLLITLIIVLILIIILLIILMKKELSKKILTKIIKFRPINFLIDAEKISNSIESFYEDLPNLQFLKIPFILSLVGWFLQFFIIFLIAKLFAINIDFIYFIAILSIANIVASIPITIYGLGTREIALISLFSMFNIIPEKIVSLSLFWFTIAWLIPSIFGGFITLREGFNKDIKIRNLLTNE